MNVSIITYNVGVILPVPPGMIVFSVIFKHFVNPIDFAVWLSHGSDDFLSMMPVKTEISSGMIPRTLAPLTIVDTILGSCRQYHR